MLLRIKLHKLRLALHCASLMVALSLFHTTKATSQYRLEVIGGLLNNEYTSSSSDILGAPMWDKSLVLRLHRNVANNTSVFVSAGRFVNQFSTRVHADDRISDDVIVLIISQTSGEDIQSLFSGGVIYRGWKEKSRLLPEMVMELGFNVYDKKPLFGSMRIANNNDFVLESGFINEPSRRVSPSMLLAARYELFSKFRLSIPIEFGIRRSFFQPEIVEVHAYRLSDPDLRTARIEKTGDATFFRFGLSLKL